MEKDPKSNRAASTPGHETWARVARLIGDHPAVKQVRLNSHDHGVTVGFYQAPSKEALDEIESAVRRELSGEWDVSIVADDDSPALHLHKVSGYTEIHQDHPENEPPIIWKSIPLPAWRNRPFPRPVPRDYRVMLVLAALCGLGTLTGFVLERTSFSPWLSATCFIVAYVVGGWFATQDMWQGLKSRKIDIQFLMIAVAFGALFVNAWTEGATLLFLFSLSNALEQWANYRTRKSIESLLKVAPKRALRRENGRWTEISIEGSTDRRRIARQTGRTFSRRWRRHRRCNVRR
jgi:Zn2+/Cd2+-exporting ATPase